MSSGGGRGDGRGISKTQLDRAVRARIAEIMSAAGVDRSRVSQEVLFELPDGFVKAYELLYDRAMVGMDKERRDDGQVGKAGDPKAGQMGGGSGGRTRVTEKSDQVYDRAVVRSGGSSRRAARGSSRGSAAGISLGVEEALRLKERIDKRLRGMARDILEELDMMGLGADIGSDSEATGEIKVAVDTARVALLRSSSREYGVKAEVEAEVEVDDAGNDAGNVDERDESTRRR